MRRREQCHAAPSHLREEAEPATAAGERAPMTMPKRSSASYTGLGGVAALAPLTRTTTGSGTLLTGWRHHRFIVFADVDADRLTPARAMRAEEEQATLPAHEPMHFDEHYSAGRQAPRHISRKQAASPHASFYGSLTTIFHATSFLHGISAHRDAAPPRQHARLDGRPIHAC